jgi:hypothetical protein
VLVLLLLLRKNLNQEHLIYHLLLLKNPLFHINKNSKKNYKRNSKKRNKKKKKLN